MVCKRFCTQCLQLNHLRVVQTTISIWYFKKPFQKVFCITFSLHKGILKYHLNNGFKMALMVIYRTFQVVLYGIFLLQMGIVNYHNNGFKMVLSDLLDNLLRGFPCSLSIPQMAVCNIISLLLSCTECLMFCKKQFKIILIWWLTVLTTFLVKEK